MEGLIWDLMRCGFHPEQFSSDDRTGKESVGMLEYYTATIGRRSRLV